MWLGDKGRLWVGFCRSPLCPCLCFLQIEIAPRSDNGSAADSTELRPDRKTTQPSISLRLAIRAGTMNEHRTTADKQSPWRSFIND